MSLSEKPYGIHFVKAIVKHAEDNAIIKHAKDNNFNLKAVTTKLKAHVEQKTEHHKRKGAHRDKKEVL